MREIPEPTRLLYEALGHGSSRAAGRYAERFGFDMRRNGGRHGAKMHFKNTAKTYRSLSEQVAARKKGLGK